MREIAVYIHIPFCASKCNYCDFNSYAGLDDYVPQYVSAVKKEIDSCKDNYPDLLIKSVFFGGGTPSYLNAEYITELLLYLKKYYDFQDSTEISIEANPGTLTKDKLEAYYNAGFNRLSIGLQAWQDTLLEKMGRIHTKEEFVDNIETAIRVGFKNINVDLIFGLPGQTMNNWMESIKAVVGYGVQHLSCYSLSIEDGTYWGSLCNDNKLKLPDEALDRQMYYYTRSFLAANGYEHYEISNFARPGYRCGHNLVYWRCEEYIGLGAGAHGYIDDKRYENQSDILKYCKAVINNTNYIVDVNIIDKSEKMKESMIMGLRLSEGVLFEQFMNLFGVCPYDIYEDKFNSLKNEGLVEVDSHMVKLTNKGLDYANKVFMEFI